MPPEAGYKVRIADGSEIGPMTLQSVKDWYIQGLITRDSLVLSPGGKTWVPLAKAINLKEVRVEPMRPAAEKRQAPAPAPRRRPAPKAAAAEADEPEAEPETPSTWRTRLAGALLLVAATGAAYFYLLPNRWLADLDAAPWREMALGLIVCGIVLLPGWEWARRLVRVVVLLATFALFPVAGILIAQGMRGRPLLVLAAAGVMLAGFVALLAGALLPLARTIVSIVVLLAGAAGLVRLGLVTPGETEAKAREWAAPERRFTDPDLDLVLDLPPAWVALKKEQPLVAAPASARLVLAEPRRGGLGFLSTQPVADPAPGACLAAFLAARGPSHPGFQETGRSEVRSGKVNGQKVVGTWQADGATRREVIAVYKDGWNCVGVSAWMPDDGSLTAAQALDAVVAGLVLSGAPVAHLDEAMDLAAKDVPHLSMASIESIMGRSASHVLSPEETFRRSHELARAGLSALSGAEASELGELTSSAASSLSRTERTRLTDYLERIRDRRPTSTDEDREMTRLMKGGALRMAPARLTRLQALFEKAIRAGLAS